jgi:hypothetical protein
MTSLSSRAAGLAFTLALAAGCAEASPSTQLVLVSDTDIPGVDGVEFKVVGPGDRRAAHTGRLPEQELPFYLTLVHNTSELSAFEVTVTALRGNDPQLSRTARVRFFPGETLVVPLHLSEKCMKMFCPGQCAEGRCLDTAMDRDDMQAWTGEPPRLDDGRDQDMDPVSGGDGDGETPLPADGGREPGDDHDDQDIPGGHEGDDQDPVDPQQPDAGLDDGRDMDAGLDNGRA